MRYAEAVCSSIGSGCTLRSALDELAYRIPEDCTNKCHCLCMRHRLDGIGYFFGFSAGGFGGDFRGCGGVDNMRLSTSSNPGRGAGGETVVFGFMTLSNWLLLLYNRLAWRCMLSTSGFLKTFSISGMRARFPSNNSAIVRI
jgi:hypothetical protein